MAHFYTAFDTVYSANDRTLIFCATTPGSDDPTDHLWSVPADGSRPPVLLDSGDCHDPSLSPDGKSIVFSSDRKKDFSYDVVIMQPGGKNARNLSVTEYTRRNQNPRFTEDGTRIFYVGGSTKLDPLDGGLYSATLNGNQVSKEATGSLFLTPLQWKH